MEGYIKKKMYDFKRIGIDEIEMIKELFTFGAKQCSNGQHAGEQSIREFCIEKKNWVMIDTAAGAESSAIIYVTIQKAVIFWISSCFYDTLGREIENFTKQLYP